MPIVIVMLVTALLTYADNDKSPAELLKSRDLIKVGQKYVLKEDAGIVDWLRQVRASEKKLNDTLKRRTNLEREIRTMEDAANALFSDWQTEKEKLSRISKNADTTYNIQVDKVNKLREQGLAQLEVIKKRVAALQEIGDPSDESVAIVLKFGSAMDATMDRYKSLAENAEIKNAIDQLNKDKTGSAKVALGPSDRLNAELPEITKLREKVNTDTIHFDLVGNVPAVPITINGSTVVDAIVDSGASYISISEDLAKKLGIHPGANDRSVNIVTADGTTHKVPVVLLKSVRLGKFSVENVECVITPGNSKKVDTLLGGSFLRRFVYKMDLSARQLKLSQVVDNSVPEKPKPSVVAAKPPVITADPTTNKSFTKGRVVDLFKLIDIDRDKLSGEWILTTNGLQGKKSNENPRLSIPYRPPAEYDLMVDFTCIDKSRIGDVILLFPANHRGLLALVGGFGNSISGFLDGPYHRDTNAPFMTHSKDVLQLGKRYTMTVRVRRTHLTLLLDSKVIIDRDTRNYSEFASLGDYSSWSCGIDNLGIGAGNQTLFHSVQITEISGPGNAITKMKPAAPISS